MSKKQHTDTLAIPDLDLADPANAHILAFFNAHVDQLSFCPLPADVLAHARWLQEDRYFTLRVVKQRGYGWSVRKINDDVLSDTGHWRYASNNRTQKAKRHTSFTLARAIELARQEAPKLTIGRYDFEGYIAKVREDIAAGHTEH